MLRAGLLCLLFSAYAVHAQQDSIKIRKYLNASLSAAYADYKNWNGETHSSISLLSGVDFRHRLSSAGWTHDHQFKAEFGYLHISDSMWMKSADQFRITLQWNEKPGKYFMHSYSVHVQSQFAPGYRYSRSEEDELVREKKSWFLAPARMELAYGMNIRFWESCRFNAAFATCRISLLPRDDEAASLVRTHYKMLKTEYGCSMQLYIAREFADKHLVWDHNGRIFFNAIDKNGVHADISNRFTIKFLRYMQFRIDTAFIYEPDISTKGSLRQEFLLGLFYEWKK